MKKKVLFFLSLSAFIVTFYTCSLKNVNAYEDDSLTLNQLKNSNGSSSKTSASPKGNWDYRKQKYTKTVFAKEYKMYVSKAEATNDALYNSRVKNFTGGIIGFPASKLTPFLSGVFSLNF